MIFGLSYLTNMEPNIIPIKPFNLRISKAILQPKRFMYGFDARDTGNTRTTISG